MNCTDNTSGGLRLIRESSGLCLTDGRLKLTADFSDSLRRLQKANLSRELLVRAVRIRRSGKKNNGTQAADSGDFPHVLRAVDATAGLGEDALLLAAAGFRVQMYESDPVIAALLRDALLRAGGIPELREIAARMELTEGDSISAMQNLRFTPDVIYLDPMFPERSKSGLIKKKFQLLQQLERPCSDEEALLSAAIAAHPRKIVIKRPIKGPYLNGRRPDYSLEGRAIRYDCICLP